MSTEIEITRRYSVENAFFVIKAFSILAFVVAVIAAVSGEWQFSAVSALVGLLYVLSYALMRSFAD